jgi:D-alanine--poly(phosphoribitol) ligase subunit 2
MIVADEQVSVRALRALREVTGSAEVLTEPDLPLYGSGLLDSLATVTLMVALGDEFGLEISPMDFEREDWATPRRLVSDVERRLAEHS